MRRFFQALAIAAVAMLGPAWALGGDQDQEIAQQIASSLRTSGQLVDYSVGVRYENGTVWLIGRVANEKQRDLAVSMARTMPSVTNVVSNLDIKSSSPTRSQVMFPENMPSNSGSERGEISQTGGDSTLTPGRPAVVQPSRVRPVSAAQPMARNMAASDYSSDPGDPLAQTSAPRFAANQSRRFASNPMQTATAGMRPSQPNANQQVAFTADPRSPQARAGAQQMQAMGADGAMMSGPQIAAAQYQLATHGGALASQPIGPGPGMVPAAYNYPRGVPPYGGAIPYGPSMGGCVGGACNGPASESPNMPGYAWPSYASYPNYGAVTYPRQYSPTAWPYIGPFYPYPQVPLGWRKVALEWDDGWWWLDFYDTHHHH